MIDFFSEKAVYSVGNLMYYFKCYALFSIEIFYTLMALGDLRYIFTKTIFVSDN